MNRRGFLQLGGAGMLGGLLGGETAATESQPEIRRVMFSPPGEPPAIHWTNGHMPIERFVWMLGEADFAAPPEQVKYGWASRKLSGVSMYLSDTQLPNFEPITYWIPADAQEESSA